MSHKTRQPPTEAFEAIRRVVGSGGWKSDAHDVAPFLEEPRGRWVGLTPLVVQPSSTEQVAQIVKICAAHKLPIVPQGGNTGLVGGQIPLGSEIVLSLSRLNAVRNIDTLNNTITLEAGCVLARVQQAAQDANRLFPLSLASEGSSQIGGLISTNAGGNAVLRYGNMRDLVLGLEVVTARGDVWNGLSGLRKDNTGYDLKQLYIGAEGTLGVITAATCKLFPAPRQSITALAAVETVESALDILNLAREHAGEAISAFELIPQQGLDLVLKHIDRSRAPLAQSYPWLVLFDLDLSQNGHHLRPTVEALLEEALGASLLKDAVIAESSHQAEELWLIRESLPEAQTNEGASLKHDISVPVSAIARFIDRATRSVLKAIPGIRPVCFGHVGDGNVHFNLTQPKEMSAESYLARRGEIEKIVHDLTHKLGGSISAEHGLGVAKKSEILRYKSDVELALMRQIKATLDPDNLMNPGKMI